jgi:hypothetical protein
MAGSYDYDELRDAVDERERYDAAVREYIMEAIQRQRRGWIADLVIDVATAVFGHIVGRVVERVVDFFFYRRRR